MNEENILSLHISLLKRGIELIGERQLKIEEQAKENSISFLPAEAEKDSAIHIFKVGSLKLYQDTLSFITQEVSTNDHTRHYFVLAHVRTLLDVYANFIHLQELPTKSRRALTCIAYQLLTYAALFGDNVYIRTLELYQNFLKQENFSFPTKVEEMDFIWVRENKLRFASKNILLTPENIKKYSNNTMKVFSPKKTHEIYSHLSEFMHGNPYYNNDNEHNERFWAISMSLMTTAFLIELVDIYTLNRRYPRDFRVWLLDIKKYQSDLLNLWASKRTK